MTGRGSGWLSKFGSSQGTGEGTALRQSALITTSSGLAARQGQGHWITRVAIDAQIAPDTPGHCENYRLEPSFLPVQHAVIGDSQLLEQRHVWARRVTRIEPYWVQNKAHGRLSSRFLHLCGLDVPSSGLTRAEPCLRRLFQLHVTWEPTTGPDTETCAGLSAIY